MIIETINFSPRAVLLLKLAEDLAEKNFCGYVHPVHILLAALRIESDVYRELRNIVHIKVTEIEQRLTRGISKNKRIEDIKLKIKELPLMKICFSTKAVLDEAKNNSQLHGEHGQLFVNDGHVLRAVLHSEDELTVECLKELNRELILSIAASPRDMSVSLIEKDFSIDSIEGICIRKVNSEDMNKVRNFVLENFYERWANTVEYGLTLKDIPIYIALEEDRILGFAGYNISRQRKGYFGPLGVLKTYRKFGIGQNLLRACLSDMKKLGYKSCIIGNASSIEFYEKACDAKVIPMK